MAQVFPGVGSGGEAFRLLVSWPDAQGGGPMAVQVALLRQADGAQVEAAVLRVTPHWLAGRSAAPAWIRRAFARYAEQLATAY